MTRSARFSQLDKSSNLAANQWESPPQAQVDVGRPIYALRMDSVLGPLAESKIQLSYSPMAEVSMLLGDNLKHLDALPSESVDLVITSPPYNIGKDYEEVIDSEDYLQNQRRVIQECVRVLKPTGSLCWQVGFTKSGAEIVPLDILLYPIFKDEGLRLKNRIVWTFGHGMHAQRRFSGRHETILWFVKSLDGCYFNLDDVRVPQKYPGKRYYRGPKKGEYSGHPEGKNPGDVWDIPNVKSHHVEKTQHQCQFPVALAQRLIRGLCPPKGTVLDPFAGVATTAAAAALEGRRSISIEMLPKYFEIGIKRVEEALAGALRFRPLDKPIQEPDLSAPVSFRQETLSTDHERE